MVAVATVLAASSVSQITVAITSLGVGAAGVFGLLKLKPERESIIAQASNNAVASVNASLGTIRTELANAQKEIGAANQRAYQAIADRDREREEERLLRHELKGRVATLEKATDLRSVMAALIDIRDSQRTLLEAHERLSELTASQTIVLSSIADRLAPPAT